MKPHISEFSYGFALTNELVGWAELSAAPVFPSLIEEGRVGGGYDVKLERPGVPLYLQFKRSDFMTRSNAREARSVSAKGGALNVPYYRFSVTEAARSDQHELLLALDTSPNFVFYAAPRFYKLDEINEAWKANAVASRSQFVAPREIGSLSDGPHTVAFDGSNLWVCSEPRRIYGLSSRELADKLRNALQQDNRPLGDKLTEIARDLQAAENRGRARIAERQREAEEEAWRRWEEKRTSFDRERDVGFVISRRAFSDQYLDEIFGQQALKVPDPEVVPTREPKRLSEEFRQLREVADTAARLFDAQLVIVQPDPNA